ncbi:MAG: PAS domain S-box protein [Nitrospinota bacterium]|nr:MAG: PAS domain S-box protein [Nitrospinota bacterium]
MKEWTKHLSGWELLESMVESVLLVDNEGRIVFVNNATEQLFGYTKAELLGQPVELLVPERFRAQHATHRTHYYSHPTPRALEDRSGLYTCKKDGSVFPVNISLSPLKTTEGLLVLVLLADLTTRQRKEAQLRQAQKLDAIGYLAKGVAHHINNHLAVILGYTEIAISSLPGNSPLWNALLEIRQAVSRSANLIRQLLLFSRTHSLHQVPLDWNQHIRTLQNMLCQLVGEEHTVTFALAERLWPVYADPESLHQVLLHLVTNAREAMPHGGTLTIATENVVIDADYCRQHSYARPGRFVCLTVSDTGIGMSAHIQAHLFEPFFTTKPFTGEGTGLGLAVVYGIVKAHQGWVTVDSRLGQGSTVRVYLPAYIREPDSAEVHDTFFPVEQFRGQGEGILLVEEDPYLKTMLEQVLRSHGYTVFSCTTGAEARAILEAEEPHIALVMSDITLPDGSGLDLVQQCQAHQPPLPVLLVSSRLISPNEWHQIAQAEVPILHKPFRPTDIVQHVYDTLHRGSL